MVTDIMPIGPGSQLEVIEPPDKVIARIKQAHALVVQIQKDLMKPGVHYGVIPGTDKPALLKEGAEVLNMAFRISAKEEEVVDLSGPDERKYKVTIGLYDQVGRRLGFGVGICSTSEDKYKWRKATKAEWEATAVERRRTKEYSGDRGAWTAYQVRTEPPDLENTVLQMAVKRGLVQATRQVHGVSDVFADITLDDLPEEVRDQLMLGNRRSSGSSPRSRSGKPPSPPPPPAAASGGAPPAPAAAAGSTPPGEPPPQQREPGSDDAPAPTASATVIPKAAWEHVREAWHERGVISAAQSKRIFGVAYGAGWTGDQVGAELRAGLNVAEDADGVFQIPNRDPYDRIVALFSKSRESYGS